MINLKFKLKYYVVLLGIISLCVATFCWCNKLKESVIASLESTNESISSFGIVTYDYVSLGVFDLFKNTISIHGLKINPQIEKIPTVLSFVFPKIELSITGIVFGNNVEINLDEIGFDDGKQSFIISKNLNTNILIDRKLDTIKIVYGQNMGSPGVDIEFRLGIQNFSEFNPSLLASNMESAFEIINTYKLENISLEVCDLGAIHGAYFRQASDAGVSYESYVREQYAKFLDGTTSIKEAEMLHTFIEFIVLLNSKEHFNCMKVQSNLKTPMDFSNFLSLNKQNLIKNLECDIKLFNK